MEEVLLIKFINRLLIFLLIIFITIVLKKLMHRGETLDSLAAKSKDISTASYSFYKNARKANSSCCSLN